MKINKLVSLCVGSVFAVGLAHASTHCNGYEIKIVNKLKDDLIISKAQLVGAELQPKHEERIAANSQLVFTVNNTSTKHMNAEFILKTGILTNHALTMNFELTNAPLRCDFDNKGSKADGFALSESHSSSQVVYTIG